MTYTDQHDKPARRLMSPREFIDKLRAAEPNADADEICRQYLVAIREHTIFDEGKWEILALTPIEEWLRATVIAARPLAPPKDRTPPRPRPPRTPEQVAARAAETKHLVDTIGAGVERMIEAEVAMRLLEYETTYGKKLGDCTGAECGRLSRNYGSFFAEVAKRLNPSDRVRNHLSELELQAIARTYRLIGPGAGER
jgi:hypothetical protein